MKQRLAFALALVFLAGCGGGGSGGSSVPATQAKAQSKTAQGSVVISIPTGAAASGSARVRYPQFVSPNASSVAMSVNGGADTIFDVSATSNLCTTTGGVRNCTLSFGAPVGSDTFAFLVFAGTGGSGAQLASASTTQTIAAGTAFGFTVALSAAIGTVVANLNTNTNANNCPNQPPNSGHGINEGCGGTAILSVTVTDPSGATVTGSAPYATPITISANDPSVSASPASITAPGQTSTLTYSGAALGTAITGSITITLTVGGVAIPQSVPVTHSYLYVANSNAPFGFTPIGGGNIAVYRFGASGNTPPIRVLVGPPNTIETPTKPLVDALGNLYVLDNGVPSGGNYDGSIFVFGTGATQSAPPLRTISHLASLGTVVPCTDMVFDPTGAFLFVACGTQINVFPVGASGLASGASTAQMQDDSTSTQTGLAFDQSGNMYISDANANQIVEVSAPVPTSGGYHASVGGGATTLAPPGSWNSLDTPQSIVVDTSGTLYAPVFYPSPSPGAGDATAELAIWNSGALNCTHCAPSTALTGAPFTAHSVAGIALDSAGNVYVANIVSGAITEFSQATVSGGSTANPPVLRTLSNTGSGQATTPIGMTVGP